MVSRLFITRLQHDIGNRYLHAYSAEIITAAEDRGWQVEGIENENVTRKQVHSRLGRGSPTVAVFNGHGSDSELCGHNNEVILDTGCVHLLKDTVVFARACNCANVLGAEAVRDGCNSFIGYSKTFIIPRVNEYNATPLRDPAANPILRTSNAVPIQLLKGDAPCDAVNASHAQATKLFARLLVSNEPYDAAALRALMHNDLCLTLQQKQ